MEPKAILYNGKVVVAVPDHVEEIMILRKSESFVFEIPKEKRKNYIHRTTNDEMG